MDFPLGLQRYTVTLFPYHREWVKVFHIAKLELETVLDGLFIDIQHIGSTSVPGLNAKPIIDIGILISDTHVLESIIPILEDEGYEYRGDAGDKGGYIFVFNIKPEFRTHHLHFIVRGDRQWENYITFRDALRENKNLLIAYKNLKRELEDKYSDDRASYSAGKERFISKVLEDTRRST